MWGYRPWRSGRPKAGSLNPTKFGMRTTSPDGARMTNLIGVLHDLAKILGGRVTKKNVMLIGRGNITQQLRAVYRGHKIELLANNSLILADIEARYGQFELLLINPLLTRIPYGKPALTIEAVGVKHSIFTIGGTLSRSQSELCQSRILRRLLDVIEPQEGEEINISQQLFRVYLSAPRTNRVMAVINAVIDLMPHETPEREFADILPEDLQPLVPLIPKWAIEDDKERSRKLRRCAQSTRRKLIDAVLPLLPAIDKFLDSLGANPPEEACALGSLAQAALEAQSLTGNANGRQPTR